MVSTHTLLINLSKFNNYIGHGHGKCKDILPYYELCVKYTQIDKFRKMANVKIITQCRVRPSIDGTFSMTFSRMSIFGSATS